MLVQGTARVSKFRMILRLTTTEIKPELTRDHVGRVGNPRPIGNRPFAAAFFNRTDDARPAYRGAARAASNFR
ncbi:MAG TPA: hypothetical protein VK493_14735 [Bryobacteraceae bacterium]|nr:hypothetical protein [Bryobacteraceae bacterium]